MNFELPPYLPVIPTATMCGLVGELPNSEFGMVDPGDTTTADAGP